MQRIFTCAGEEGHWMGGTNTKFGPDESLELCHTHPSWALQVPDSALRGLLQEGSKTTFKTN
ncbi:hypothetical protein E2C01_012827 [Portunus trituberculatus]|uniref:Uncharacterized protein n=1 Tax=Portunus trituberculatus TaxID=210409 RepID=A0A5B7DFB0_PORTR|nr:hypothetical protein [Portunus trituberculatus]